VSNFIEQFYNIHDMFRSVSLGKAAFTVGRHLCCEDGKPAGILVALDRYRSKRERYQCATQSAQA
jgi:hypothetical protein